MSKWKATIKETVMTRKNIISLAVIVLLGLLLQAGYVALDATQTPADAAVSYARAYYQLCPSMARYLCDSPSAANTRAAVDEYIYATTAETAERGFGKNLAKYALSHIETRTEYQDKKNAVVYLTARRRVAINPVYAYVARLFRLGETFEVNARIQLQLKDGRWRVCDSSLPLLNKS